MTLNAGAFKTYGAARVYEYIIIFIFIRIIFKLNVAFVSNYTLNIKLLLYSISFYCLFSLVFSIHLHEILRGQCIFVQIYGLLIHEFSLIS